jgi:hypothetical protein
MPKPDREMREADKKNILKLEPGTVIALVAMALLIPLLLTGFFAQ